MSEEFYRDNLNRNFIVTVLEGAFIALGNGMAPLTTVLLFFISDFVTEKWLLGLLPCLFSLLVFSPQVLVSRKIEGLRTYKSFSLLMSALNRLPWLLLALNVYFFAESNPTLFIVNFYVLYSLIGLMIGFYGLTTICRISKVIPDRARGRLMGTKSTIGGLFELAGSFVMGYILKSQGYPINYAILFLVVFISMSVSLIFIALTKETESVYVPVQQDDSRYFHRMFAILKNDRPFTFLIVALILINAFGKMPFAFQTVYAKDKLGITSDHIFMATIALLTSQTIGYMFWGYIGDKYGHRLPLVIGSIIFVPAIIVTYFMSNQVVYLAAICILGISQSAFNVNTDNLSISLCKDKSSLPTYIGLRCLVTGPFIAFSSLLAGLIIDYLGYGVMFGLALIFILAGLYVLVAKVKHAAKKSYEKGITG